MSDPSELPSVTATTSSPSLEDYYRQALERVRRELPDLANRLKSIGVVTVYVSYDGCGDSGQIEEIVCRDVQGHHVRLTGKTPATDDQLADLFYDLIDARHPDWGDDDGACGELVWDLEADTLKHTHNVRFTDYSTTEHEGL